MIGEILTVIRADGDVVCTECRVATKFSTRFRGLLGMTHLPAGRGVLLSRTNFIHTHFLRFPIDVVFLDSDLAILEAVEGLRPWRLARRADAAAVLELADGSCRRAGLRVGDRLTLVSGAVGRDEVRSLRVALSTSDRRFLRVASFLLGRHGFAIVRGRDEDLDDLVRRGEVDVVLLDASDSVVDAARKARSLQASAPGVGLVLAVDGVESNGDHVRRDGDAPLRIDRVAKWGAFESIVRALERSYEASRDHVPT